MAAEPKRGSRAVSSDGFRRTQRHIVVVLWRFRRAIWMRLCQERASENDDVWMARVSWMLHSRAEERTVRHC